MKIIKSVAAALAVLTLALVGLYFGMAERVEVVVLHSHGADGDHETRLWVLDDAGHAWLRTGATNATWLPRIRSNPAVELERGDETLRFDAEVIDDPSTVERINRLSLEKYGWSEELLRRMGAEPGAQVAIRLQPRSRELAPASRRYSGSRSAGSFSRSARGGSPNSVICAYSCTASAHFQSSVGP